MAPKKHPIPHLKKKDKINTKLAQTKSSNNKPTQFSFNLQYVHNYISLKKIPL